MSNVQLELKGYTAKGLLKEAFSRLNPKNWLGGPDVYDNDYWLNDHSRHCIIGKCAEIIGWEERGGFGKGTVGGLEEFLFENGIRVSDLIYLNDHAANLESFKLSAKERGWL